MARRSVGRDHIGQGAAALRGLIGDRRGNRRRGEGGAQTAPLGRAVIGGLLAATAATLVILPSIFSVVQEHATARSASLDPDDPESPYAEPQPSGPGRSNKETP